MSTQILLSTPSDHHVPKRFSSRSNGSETPAYARRPPRLKHGWAWYSASTASNSRPFARLLHEEKLTLEIRITAEHIKTLHNLIRRGDLVLLPRQGLAVGHATSRGDDCAVINGNRIRGSGMSGFVEGEGGGGLKDQAA